MRVIHAALLVIAFATALPAQWLGMRTPGIPRTANGKADLTAPTPRTPDSKPDLTGLWEFPIDVAIGNITMRNIGGLKPEEIQPWARALVEQRAENLGRDNPRYRCLPEGPGYSTGGGVKRFVQTPAMLLMLSEDLTFRQIFTDGRKLEANPNPTWMGYSVGHWDGDTLVIESNGFNDRTWMLDGYPHTEKLKMTERYRRPDFGHLEATVTFEDPSVYARPITVPVAARYSADNQLLESVCNENNDNGQEHWVGKLSETRHAAVRVAPEVLAKYVGVYKGQYIGGPRSVEITLSGDSIYIALNGGPKEQLFPQSETTFGGTGLTYSFVRGQDGVATQIIESHISGDFHYARQR